MEERCLVYWMQQVKITGNKRYFCSFLSLVVGTDVVEIHKKLTSDKSNM